MVLGSVGKWSTHASEGVFSKFRVHPAAILVSQMCAMRWNLWWQACRIDLIEQVSLWPGSKVSLSMGHRGHSMLWDDFGHGTCHTRSWGWNLPLQVCQWPTIHRAHRLQYGEFLGVSRPGMSVTLCGFHQRVWVLTRPDGWEFERVLRQTILIESREFWESE